MENLGLTKFKSIRKPLLDKILSFLYKYLTKFLVAHGKMRTKGAPMASNVLLHH